MYSMSKINLCVFFGGQSPEHEISCISATQVLKSLNKDKYSIYPVGITKTGDWLLYMGEYDKIAAGSWVEEGQKCFVTTKAIIIEKGLQKIPVDVGFPIIHGEMGEDGAIVGLLKINQIPFCGSGIGASACGLDKALSKLVYDGAGIPQVPYKIFRIYKDADKLSAASDIEKAFGYPVVIKPSSTGSSIGITKAKNKEELILAINEATAFGAKIIAEKFVDCREVEVSVLGNEEPLVSVCGEVFANTEFYDYNSKYYNDKLKICIPAEIDEKTADAVRKLAKKAYLALECRGFARADFFVGRTSDEIYINEINTIPGCTGSSMFPMLLEKTGIPFSETLDRIIEFATK